MEDLADLADRYRVVLASHPDLHATIRLVSLPTKDSLAAAHDRRSRRDRELVIIGLHEPDHPDRVVGWGECSALNAPTYTHEWAGGAFELLTTATTIHASTAPMAAAAIEMAHLDRALRETGHPLASLLNTTGKSALAGAVVGLGPVDQILDRVEQLSTDGYRRVKLKVTPEHLAAPVQAVRERFADIEIQIDANGSLGLDDLNVLLDLEALGVSAFEQPFAPDDHHNAASLVEATDVAVVADESLTDQDSLAAIQRLQTATAIAVKPPRVGGLSQAVQIATTAKGRDLRCSVGGMLESGLGRHVLAALAPSEPFTIHGDLSPASRWLAVDPFCDIKMAEGCVAAPTTIGIAGDPDLAILQAHTVAQWTGPCPQLPLSIATTSRD